MTWADTSDMAGGAPTDEALELTQECTVEAAVFEGHARRRMALLATVFGGGLTVIVLMRLVFGGPTEVQADPVDEEIVAKFLEPAESGASPMISTFGLVSIFGQGSATEQHVPWSRVKGNPFILPGAESTAATPMPTQTVNSVKRAREAQLREQVEAMRVSMVLRGRHTVAVVGDISLPLAEVVELDPQTRITLVRIDGSGVHVRLDDPVLDVRVEVALSRP